MAIDWKTLKEVAGVLTPLLIFLIGVIVIPLLWRINRRHFLFETKIDSIVYANKTVNGKFADYSKDWANAYDKKFSELVGERKFVDGR